MVNFYKSEISLLKDQNSFLKSELQQKQIIVEKLLDLQQKDQSKINCSKINCKHDNNRSNFDNTNFDKNLSVKNKSLELVGTILMDLSKGYDCIPHKLLIVK